MQHNTRILIRICPALCGYCVKLIAHWLSYVDVAVLHDCSSVAKNEVHSSINVTVAVELALGVYVESVLITLEAAAVKN